MFRYTLGASLVAQMVKNMPVMQKLQVWSQGQEDPLEEEMATQSSIRAWEIPWTEESGGLQSIELQRVRHSSVQSFSRVWLLVTHGLQHAGPPCPSSTPGAYWNPYPSSGWYHLILCCPLLLPPSILLSIRDFSNESILCLRWLNYWNFRFSISPSNEYSGLIFRTDWLDLLAV